MKHMSDYDEGYLAALEDAAGLVDEQSEFHKEQSLLEHSLDNYTKSSFHANMAHKMFVLGSEILRLRSVIEPEEPGNPEEWV